MFKFTPHQTTISALVAATLAMSTFTMSAQATPITWTLNNATLTQTQTFNFMGTNITNAYNYVVTGSFIYDADTKLSSNANFSFIYNSPWATNQQFTSSGAMIKYDTLNNQTDLTFTEGPAFRFDGVLSNLGGTKTFKDYTQYVTASGSSSVISTGTLTANSVSAVPVPAAAWLFGSGLMGLAGLRRRKQAV